VNQQTDHEELTGRGNREGAKLFRDWFQELSDSAARGEKAAYVYVLGSLTEILRTFDFPIAFPEINSLQTAVRGEAHHFLDEAEDHGYSPDICGYVKIDYATQMRGGEHPMGTVPKPSIAVFSGGCATYIKWAEIWERMYKIPIFTLDLPGPRAAGNRAYDMDLDFNNDIRYVEAQIKELITICEDVSGQKFDIDKLRQVLEDSNTVARCWSRILELNKSRPTLFNALADGTVYLGVANGLRGTPQGARYFERLLEEMEYKAANGIGTVTNEKHRLMLVGGPCYPIYRRFSEMFSEWGGEFVLSSYMWFASGCSNDGFQYDLTDPIRSLAEGTLRIARESMECMFYQPDFLRDKIEEYGIDGLIYHPVKSCRTVSTGLADARRDLAGISGDGTPSLFIESDIVDRRVISEAQMKNRIDAFFEGLESRQQTRALKQAGLNISIR